MLRFKETGTWLTATPFTPIGTVLSAEEFRDNLYLQFGLNPSYVCPTDVMAVVLYSLWDIPCNVAKVDGLILQQHNMAYTLC